MQIRNKCKKLPKSVDVRTYNRPMRVAYLVPSDEQELNHWILDGIFAEAYGRWGGARSLIIPYHNGEHLSNVYEKWLSFYDPDFIYSYVDLNEKSIERINLLCLPIAFIRHSVKSANSWHQFIPSWTHHINPIPAISTMMCPLSDYPGWSQTQTPQIYISQHPENCDSRFLPDNFAVANTSTNIHRCSFETICYTPTEVPENHIIGTYRCSSLPELISKLANKEVRYFAKLSSIHSKGIFTPNDNVWGHSFHIIIGESVLDRIHFWNIRNFSPGWTSNTQLSSLIISPVLIENEEFCKATGDYLNKHNFLKSSNGPPTIYVTSYSLNRDVTSKLIKKLKGNQNTFNYLTLSNKFAEKALPDPDSFKQHVFTEGIPVPSFKLYDSENNILAMEPEHFKYLPPNLLYAKNGQWVVDIEIERHNDDSNIINAYNDWKLPRRPEILGAFSDNLGKINKRGCLSLIPSSNSHSPLLGEQERSYKIHLSLPEDETVFQFLVVGGGGDYYDYRKSLNRTRYFDMQLSDKGQNHRGIVSKFANVREAAKILTNKYWRNIIRKCVSNPDKNYSLNQLVGRIKNLDRNELDRLNKFHNFDNVKKIKAYLENNLEDTIHFLVHNGVVQQIHKWRCLYCGNLNKRGLDSLYLKNKCDVCQKNYDCPIDIKWLYSPSRFIVDTLAVRNGLTVLWAVSYLFRLSWSEGSIYLPEVDLIKSGNDYNHKNEIDILAIIDGVYYAGEVKFSVSSFIDNQREIDVFVEEINILRPDVAVLAFEVYEPDSSTKNTEELKVNLRNVLTNIKEKIPGYIKLKKLVAEDDPEFSDFPVDLGPWGIKTNSFLDKDFR